MKRSIACAIWHFWQSSGLAEGASCRARHWIVEQNARHAGMRVLAFLGMPCFCLRGASCLAQNWVPAKQEGFSMILLPISCPSSCPPVLTPSKAGGAGGKLHKYELTFWSTLRFPISLPLTLLWLFRLLCSFLLLCLCVRLLLFLFSSSVSVCLCFSFSCFFFSLSLSLSQSLSVSLSLSLPPASPSAPHPTKVKTPEDHELFRVDPTNVDKRFTPAPMAGL